MNQPDELRQQIDRLTASVETLTKRIAVLEKTASKPAPQPVQVVRPMATMPATGPRQKTVTINPGARAATAIGGFIALFLGGLSGFFVVAGFIALVLALIWPWTRKIEVATSERLAGQPHVGSAPAVAKIAVPRQASKFEQDLAKHWFSWLGIISLVVGITLLLNYAFQGYGPIGRIFTGYCAAGMLFGLWFWLRRMYRGFAFILQSGAWAVVYISTFALHVIEGHPIASGTNAGILLLAVVVIITVAAYLQKSKPLTAGAFFLGYITAFTNDVSLFTLVALLLLSIGAVAVASFQAWPEFVVAATIATYAVQFAWMISQNSLGAVAATAAGFLVLEVLVFGAAHWLIAPRTSWHRQLTTAGTVGNLIGFYWLFNWMVGMTNNQYGWLATIFIGIVCGLLAAATSLSTTRRFLRPIYIVFAIGFITLGLSQKLHGDSLTLTYLIESAAVVCIGALMNERTIRWSGYAVSAIATLSLFSILVGPVTMFGTTNVHTRLLVGLFGAMIFALDAAMLRYRQGVILATERYVPIVFADLGLAMLMIVLGQELPAAWVPFAWSLLAFGLVVYGAEKQSINARTVGYIVALFSAFFWLANVDGSTSMAGTLNLHARLLSGIWVIVMYLLSAFVLRLRAGQLTNNESITSTVYTWATVIMLATVLGSEVPSRLLSVAWGIEGVILYIIGFATQSVQARRQGLLILGLTIVKVYVFDVQSLATPFKILSFIILGLILLGIGFLYNRWRQQQKPTDHS